MALMCPSHSHKLPPRSEKAYRRESTITEHSNRRWYDAALARHFPESSRTPTFGGTAYWVRGPQGLDARALKVRAEKQGILIEPGDIFFSQQDPPLNYFRLGFSSIPVERIEQGIEQLAELAHSMC